MQWHESDVESNGVTIHVYRSEGENGSEKPPFLLLHGATDDGLCWPRVVEALAPEYEMITIDARGHGKSTQIDTGYMREDHARDAAGVIQALGLDQAIVAGHSMGANNTAALAAMYPELVRAAILEDPPWIELDQGESVAEFSQRNRQSIRDRQAMSPDELLSYYKKEFPLWSDVQYEYSVQAKYAVNENVSSGISETNFDWHGVAEAIQCPTLVLTADAKQGGMVTAETTAQIEAANPKITIRNIADAGHNIRRDQFDAYMAAVREFLAGL